MMDQFAEWRRMIAGEKPEKLDMNNPCSGYYRLRRKDRNGAVSYVPLAFWRDDDGLNCLLNDEPINYTKALEQWVWALPVTYEAYLAAVAGKPWPDVDEVVVGHNNAPPDDSTEAISDRIQVLKERAEAILKSGVNSDDDADKASDLSKSFLEMQNSCERLRIAEKEPHLTASRDVDKKWTPLRDLAMLWKNKISRDLLTPFMVRKENEKRAQAAAQAVAEAALRAAQEADRLAAHGATGETSAALASPPPPRTDPIKVTAGSLKRATGLRDQTSAAVADWGLLLAHLRDNSEIRSVAQRLANAAAKAGHAMPGTTIKTERIAA